MTNNDNSGQVEGFHKDSSPPQLEPSKADRKRCKGVTKSGEPCTAWAMEGGFCYFHANPDKAAELGRNGGRRRKHTYEQATKDIASPESAADVRRMLAETMAEVKAGKMDPKVANTLAYVGTALLRAYQADVAPSVNTPPQPLVPLIYRSLIPHQKPTEIYDYQTGKLIAPEAPALPTPASPATSTETAHDEAIEVEILGC